MTPAPELHDHSARQARADFQPHLDRLSAAGTGPEHQALMDELTAVVDEDPTLLIRSEGERLLDLIAELARQTLPLERQAALAREHARIGADTALTATERERARLRLGKIHPTAEQELADVRARLRRCLQALRDLARPDWHTPAERRRLALERMPDAQFAEQVLAQAADQPRQRVQGPLAVDPALPEAHCVLALADQLQALAAPRTCTAPGCTAPLPPAEPGRERRYCSPRCRTRARRTGSTETTPRPAPTR